MGQREINNKTNKTAGRMYFLSAISFKITNFVVISIYIVNTISSLLLSNGNY